MKRIVTILILIVVVIAFSSCTVDAKKKTKQNKKKYKTTQTIKVSKKGTICPYCGNAASTDCPYYYYDASTDTYKHMTNREIKDFEWSESHYQDANGNWVVR